MLLPVIFCPIDWHLCIRHFEKRKFILTFALSFLLNYLCFWCLHSIRMSSFVPVTTFNDDLTIKNQTLRHIFKKTETLMSVLLNLTPAARGFFIGQGQTQLININISLFTNWQGGGTNIIVALTLRVHSFSLTFFLWDKQNAVLRVRVAILNHAWRYFVPRDRKNWQFCHCFFVLYCNKATPCGY